jgi:hypothetical protein
MDCSIIIILGGTTVFMMFNVLNVDRDLADSMAATAPAGVRVQIVTLKPLSAGQSEILGLFISLARDVSVGVFSAWLYDKIKGKPAKIEYRRKEIHCEQGEIRRVVEEHLTIGDDDE